MVCSKFLKTFTLAALIFAPAVTQGKEIIVRTPHGNNLIFDINPEEPFAEVMEKISMCLDLSTEEQMLLFKDSAGKAVDADYVPGQKEYCLDYKMSNMGVYKAAKSPGKNSDWRDYNVEVTEEERDIIYYIISTMGSDSLVKIYNKKSSLKKAGDKLDHLHPFRFLMTIFTDEDLKVSMANLKGREWVWGYFKDGLFTSLTEETKRNNVTLDQIQDFAKNVGIKHELIINSLKKKDWDEFISILIKNVPREGNPDRYDM